MFRGTVVTEFVDRVSGRHYRPGATYSTKNAERRDEIISAGEARGVVFVEFEDRDPDLDPRLTVVGGGWYELPNGERVRGREKAVEALAALDADGDGEKTAAAEGDGAEDDGDEE